MRAAANAGPCVAPRSVAIGLLDPDALARETDTATRTMVSAVEAWLAGGAGAGVAGCGWGSQRALVGAEPVDLDEPGRVVAGVGGATSVFGVVGWAVVNDEHDDLLRAMLVEGIEC